jgi:hypothetical protein
VKATDMATNACEKHSGRVGQTAKAKALNEEMVRFAVTAHVRYLPTLYE